MYFGYRNLEWTFVKNMPARLFWRYLPVHILVSAAEFVWFLAKGRGLSLLRAKRDALAGLRQARNDRRQVQAGRVIPDEALKELLDRSSLIARFASRVRRPG